MKRLPFVYVVDDHAPMRASLIALLADVAEVSTFASAEEFLDQHATLSPGILLTDIRMDGISGLQLVARVANLKWQFRPVIMTAHGDIDAAIEALRLGACDFLQKPFGEDELFRIIEREAGQLGGSPLPDDRKLKARNLLQTLSPREREVTQELARGATNKAIAHSLNLSVRTVEMHRARAMARLGCKTLAELVNLTLLSDMFDVRS